MNDATSLARRAHNPPHHPRRPPRKGPTDMACSTGGVFKRRDILVTTPSGRVSANPRIQLTDKRLPGARRRTTARRARSATVMLCARVLTRYTTRNGVRHDARSQKPGWRHSGATPLRPSRRDLTPSSRLGGAGYRAATLNRRLLPAVGLRSRAPDAARLRRTPHGGAHMGSFSRGDFDRLYAAAVPSTRSRRVLRVALRDGVRKGEAGS